MSRNAAKGALAALAILASEPYAAELVPLEWAPDGRFARELTVPPAKFVEVCGKLAAGSRVGWTFQASGPMNFNVHFHAGKEVRYPAKLDRVAHASGTLDAEVDQDYCWMWTNQAASAAKLSIELRKN